MAHRACGFQPGGSGTSAVPFTFPIENRREGHTANGALIRPLRHAGIRLSAGHGLTRMIRFPRWSGNYPINAPRPR